MCTYLLLGALTVVQAQGVLPSNTPCYRFFVFLWVFCWCQSKFLVVASDGIWEFITNQAVVQTLDQYSDPLKAWVPVHRC